MTRRGRAARWYDDECENRAGAAFAAVKAARDRDGARRRRAVWHACLYGDGGTEQLSSVVSAYGPKSLQFNVVRRNVDTTQAKIAKARPLPLALTSGGDFRQRRRAQKLSKFFSGMFDELAVFETSELVARDALIFGTGISHTYREGAQIQHERVLIWELDVDPGDARYGRPRCLYRHQWRDRAEVAALYPEHADAVWSAGTTTFNDDPLRDRESRSDEDTVLVLECWRLPTSEDAGDGRHMICVSAAGGLLLDEEYVYMDAPFALLHCLRPLMGYWGDGFGHILEGIQFELNRVAAKVQDSEYMMGSYILVDDNSGVEVEHLDNGVATVIRTSGGGAPPQWVSPPANSPQTLQYLEQLRGTWSYEESGTSALSAQSRKPAGLDSGAALRTFSDIESERFVLLGKQYERYHVALAWAIYRLATEIAESGTKLSAKATYQRRVDRIEWAEVKLDRADLVLRSYPTSALSQDPAERRAELAEWVNSGFIPPEMARALLEFPDLEEFQRVEDAPRQLIEDIIWRLLDADLRDDDAVELLYIAPQPSFDLGLCVRLGSLHYARALLDGAAQENLDLLMRFVTDAQQMIPPPITPMAPPEMAPSQTPAG